MSGPDVIKSHAVIKSLSKWMLTTLFSSTFLWSVSSILLLALESYTNKFLQTQQKYKTCLKEQKQQKNNALYNLASYILVLFLDLSRTSDLLWCPMMMRLH